MIQKFFQCEVCRVFVAIAGKGRAGKYCGRSCAGKAYYRRRKAGLPYRHHLHGLSHHPLYHKWEGMMDRCNNPNRKSYKNYGGRGIQVCERWLDPANFISDIEALGPRPTPRHSIDRKDNNGNYEPANVRWLDQTHQNFNQRTRRDNTAGHRGITYDRSRSKWSATLGISGRTINGGRFETLPEAIARRHQLQVDNGVSIKCCG